MMSFQSSACDILSLESAVSSSSLSSGYCEDNMSVKDRAQLLNRIQSESNIQKTSPGSLGAVRSSNVKKGRDADGDDGYSTSSSYSTLGPLEKDWLVKCSSSDYQLMNQLLSKHPELVQVRDFVSTALHWAAKHGNKDVIKLVMNKPGINVNQRTGYTALHLAAIFGHEDVIELLKTSFNADVNLRDYSGKKAKQYLSNSAMTCAQQLLSTSRLDSKTAHDKDKENFLRNAGNRHTNRESAILSMIKASNSAIRHTAMWTTGWGSSSDVTNDNTTSRSSPLSSLQHSAEPSPCKTSKQRNHDLMPPPGGISRARHSKTNYSFSKESLLTEDKKLGMLKLVPHSESEPYLEAASGTSKSTVV